MVKMIPSSTAREGESRATVSKDLGSAEDRAATPTATKDLGSAEDRAAKPSTTRRKARQPMRADDKSAAARAAEIASARYGVSSTKAKPMTVAERRAKRRQSYVAVSVELPAETAAALIALAESSGKSKTAVIRDLIDGEATNLNL